MTMRMIAAKFALTAVLAGSLAAGASGVAGAAQGSGSGAAHTHHAAGAERARMCRTAQRRLALYDRRQQKFASGTAAFGRLEAKATQAGHTKLAAYWAKVVARRNTGAARHQARMNARNARSAGKCG
jgi:hypothetical protein